VEATKCLALSCSTSHNHEQCCSMLIDFCRAPCSRCQATNNPLTLHKVVSELITNFRTHSICDIPENTTWTRTSQWQNKCLSLPPTHLLSPNRLPRLPVHPRRRHTSSPNPFASLILKAPQAAYTGSTKSASRDHLPHRKTFMDETWIYTLLPLGSGGEEGGRASHTGQFTLHRGYSTTGQ
jgi:hypothetical protein